MRYELRKPVHASFAITEHFIVPEADDDIPLILNVGGAQSVGFAFVLPAVDLDHNPHLMAGKVGDIVTDRNLKPETRLWEIFLQQPLHA